MADSVACSVVVPCYNEQDALPHLYGRLSEVMQKSGVTYEILLVNDGSRDRTWEVMQEIRAKDTRVSIINLSRNFGHQIAVTAGIDHARGDAVVLIDADLQDPPEVILEMLKFWREGYDVAYGQRTHREGESTFKRTTAAFFYRILRRLTAVNIPVDTGDFRLMSRRVVDTMKRLPERHRFIRGLVAWVGFKQIAVPYRRASRVAGETKYPLSKMIKFAVDAIVSFSIAPLRLATHVGLLACVGALLYALYAIYIRVFTDTAVPGWASLIVAVMFLGGMQLVCLGVIGEYIGRIYDEVKSRPLYLLQEIQQGEEQVPSVLKPASSMAAVK